MYDYHMHSSVSFDSKESALKMAETAKERGLKEICFTDHKDYCKIPESPCMSFSIEEYKKAYDNLHVEGLKIRKGMEYGLTDWNRELLKEDLKLYDFDFVIGSVHFVKEIDPYEDSAFWQGKTIEEAYQEYLEAIYNCLKIHDDFDVLGHITYVSKCGANPWKTPLNYNKHREISDEILRLTASKGKGIEINTSGIDKTGDYLPPVTFLKRFKELGGEIVTVGSDAHNYQRVGQYVNEAIEIVKDIFGAVCTFEKRKPIFHK